MVLKLKIKELNIFFIVVGEGKEFQYMSQFIQKNNLNKYIRLIGFQNKEMVYNIRKQVDINLCLLDGFSLIEACAGSKPIIAYDIEWHSELIKDNQTGFLVQKRDINEIIAKIIYLMKNPKKSASLGKNARDLAYKNHDIKNTTKQKQYIYQELI
jgi:glycosyltransferase involved in cell wall biosynthesis